jgi:hypothetical protein
MSPARRALAFMMEGGELLDSCAYEYAKSSGVDWSQLDEGRREWWRGEAIRLQFEHAANEKPPEPDPPGPGQPSFDLERRIA